MSNILDKIRNVINEHALIKKKDTVIVACSGGPDSVALFHLLKELVDEYELGLYLAHLNHGIREEADEDEEFVRHMAKAAEVEIVCKKVDCLKLKKEWRVSLEGAARRARYDFLINMAKMLNVSKVALGHTANDQAETVLMRLIRGSGLRGMAGILPIRYSFGIGFIRPLLRCEKEEILKYLSAKGIPYKTDRTNFKRFSTRNKIRLDIIPYIKRNLNPSIIRSISRAAELLREDNTAIEELICQNTGYHKGSLDVGYYKAFQDVVKKGVPITDWKGFLFAQKEQGKDKDFLYFELASLRSFPLGIQRRILIHSLTQFCNKRNYKGIHFEHIQAILRLISHSEGVRELVLPCVRIYLQDQKLFICSKDFDLDKTISGSNRECGNKIKQTPYEIKITGNTYVECLGLTIKTKLLNRQELKEIPSDPLVAFLDYDTLSMPIEIRTRRPGDRFHPLGMPGKKKLKEFFINEKVMKNLRDSWPLLSSGADIFWVVGLRIGHPYQVTSKTLQVLKVDFE